MLRYREKPEQALVIGEKLVKSLSPSEKQEKILEPNEDLERPEALEIFYRWTQTPVKTGRRPWTPGATW